MACGSYAVQIVGSTCLLLARGEQVPLLLGGIILFGAGIGNATSLPPLIAQIEFADDDVQRVVALIIAVAQGTYAFAPATFGLIRELVPPAAPGAAPACFAAAAVIQLRALSAFLAGWADRSLPRYAIAAGPRRDKRLIKRAARPDPSGAARS